MFNIFHALQYETLTRLSSNVIYRKIFPGKASKTYSISSAHIQRYKSKSGKFFENLMKTMSAAMNKPGESEMQKETAVEEGANVKQRSASKSKAKGENVIPASKSKTKVEKQMQGSDTDSPNSKKNNHKHKHQKASKNKDGNQRNKNGQNNVSKSSKGGGNIPHYLLSAQPNQKKKENQKDSSYNYEDDDMNEGEEQHETKRDKRKKVMLKLPEVNFEPYIKFEECSEGLKNGELMQGSLRINVRNFHEAFITSTIGGRDIFIDGVAARNRALPGDIVAVQLLPKSEWKKNNNSSVEQEENNENEDDLVKTAKVVFIIEKKHPRVASGHLNPFRNNAFGFALLSPIDNRLPRLMIPLTDCPQDFKITTKRFFKNIICRSYIKLEFKYGICVWEVNEKFR